MKKRILALIAIVLGLWDVGVGAVNPLLRVYLPRAVTANRGLLTLGAISIVRGDDPKLKRKVSAIAMGRSPVSKEKIVITRKVIAGRLAANGIASDQVRITGAKAVTVTLDQAFVKAEEIVNIAEKFLKENRPGPVGVRWKVWRTPKDLPVPTPDDVKLQPRFAENPPAGCVKVEVTAISGSTPLGTQEVLFKLLYPQKQAVATRNIRAGETITPQNTNVQQVTMARPVRDWTNPYGMVAVKTIRPGTVLRPGLIDVARPPLVVKRRNKVIMRIVRECFRITTLGEALEDGRVGEFIKVRNVDTQRVISAKVASDGSVEPLFEEANK